mmetsp:Transcript_80154/g.194354  ORF Transcript_80154/g.194354 Transcript_80154/m.194354 type:complete len:207 (-) Transcript_80154:172-792(-)
MTSLAAMQLLVAVLGAVIKPGRTRSRQFLSALGSLKGTLNNCSGSKHMSVSPCVSRCQICLMSGNVHIALISSSRSSCLHFRVIMADSPYSTCCLGVHMWSIILQGSGGKIQVNIQTAWITGEHLPSTCSWLPRLDWVWTRIESGRLFSLAAFLLSCPLRWICSTKTTPSSSLTRGSPSMQHPLVAGSWKSCNVSARSRPLACKRS